MPLRRSARDSAHSVTVPAVPRRCSRRPCPRGYSRAAPGSSDGGYAGLCRVPRRRALPPRWRIRRAGSVPSNRPDRFPRCRCTPLDDQRDGPVGQAGGDPTVAIDRAEHRAIGDAGGLQPRPQRRDGAGRVPVATTPTIWPAAFLVGLAARDGQLHALVHEAEVGHGQRRVPSGAAPTPARAATGRGRAGRSGWWYRRCPA